MSSLAEQFVNLFTNPSFETAGAPVTLATNLLTNPSFEMAGAPTTILTNLLTNPSMQWAGAAVTLRTNLCTNPNFETNTTGWNVAASTTATQSTTEHHSGTASLAVVTQGVVSDEGVYGSFTGQVSGQTYTMGVWVKAPAGASLYLRNRMSGSPTVDSADVQFTGTGAWQWVASTANVAGSGTTNMQPQIRTKGAQAITFYVDDVLIEQASYVGTAFDGSTPATGDFTYAWTGTANASTSTQSGLPVAGWSSQNDYTYQTSAPTHSRSHSLAAVLNPVVSAGAYTAFGQTIGNVYTLSAWVYSATAVTMQAAYTNGNVSAGGTATAIPANTWTRIWVTGTATGSTTGYLSILTSVAPPAGTLVYVDDAQAVLSPALVDYFDGSTPAAGDFTYAWTGTADASQSVQNASTPPNVTSANTGTNGVAPILSTAWSADGVQSLRLIALGSGPNTAANVVVVNGSGTLTGGGVTLTAGQTYTLVGTCRLAAPQTGVLYSQARAALAYNNVDGWGNTPFIAAPNTTGSHDLRLTFTIAAGATQAIIRLYNGASAGGGDIWWDNLALIEGVYTGPAFNGATAVADYLTYAWTGAANASTSIELGTTVAAVTGGFQSGMWASQGTHSLFVPAGETATVPVSGLSTVMITPQSAGQAVTFDSTQVVSTGGNPITSTATTQVTFGPGYWDGLAILAPGYEGGYFDGSTPAATTVDGITTYAWNGPVGASTSTMTIVRYYTSNFNGLTWGPGTDIQLVEIDGLRSMKTRTSDETYPEEDGSLPGIDLLDERTITYKLMIAAPQTMTVEQALQACAAAFQVIRDPGGGLPLQVMLPGWTEPRQLTVRPINNDVPIDVAFSLQYVQFSVQFTAADPLIYSSTSHSLTTGLPSPTAGLPFNVTFPASFGSSTGGSVLVTNAGNYATRPVITITGPCINPQVSNGTDFMQFDLTLASTDVLVIDMAAKSVTLNGTASRYNTVATGSAWWSLPPGNTTVVFETGDGAQVAATMTIQWRDAWGMM